MAQASFEGKVFDDCFKTQNAYYYRVGSENIIPVPQPLNPKPSNPKPQSRNPKLILQTPDLNPKPELVNPKPVPPLLAQCSCPREKHRAEGVVQGSRFTVVKGSWFRE